MMENGLAHTMEDNEADVETKAQEQTRDNRHRWLNGKNLNI